MEDNLTVLTEDDSVHEMIFMLAANMQGEHIISTNGQEWYGVKVPLATLFEKFAAEFKKGIN